MKNINVKMQKGTQNSQVKIWNPIIFWNFKLKFEFENSNFLKIWPFKNHRN
jgi:hypothetical protein